MRSLPGRQQAGEDKSINCEHLEFNKQKGCSIDLIVSAAVKQVRTRI